MAQRYSAWLIAIAAVMISIVSAPGPIGILGAGLAVVMIVMAVVDLRNFIIPDGLNAAGFVLALVHASVREPDVMFWAMMMALMRGAALALVFLAIRVGYFRIRERHGLGLGDVKLAAVAGAWLDWMMIPIALELAVLAALTGYVVRQFVLGRSISLKSRLPFGVFLAPAIWICWLLETIGLGSLES